MNEATPVPAPAKQAVPAVERTLANPLGWLRGEIDRLFDDFSFTRPARSVFSFPQIDALRPATDLVDEGTGYRLSVELPGLRQDDINVEYSDGVLSITGEKREESEKKEGGCLISERRFGSVHRQLSLPADVDTNGISAEFKDGVLKVSLKKDEAAATKARKIEIH